MTSGPAHDYDAAGLIDAAGDIGDVRRARRQRRPRLQGREARNAAFSLRPDNVLRQREMGDTASGIGGGDRLMNDARRLRER